MRVLVYLLLLGLCPGASEALVDAGHALLNGHSPHVEIANHDHDSGGDAHDEHSCTGLFHLCGCHAPAPTVTATHFALSSARAAAKWSITDPQPTIAGALLLAADGASMRGTRPPIA